MIKIRSGLLHLAAAGGLMITLALQPVTAYAQTENDPVYEKELQEARDRILTLFTKKVKGDGLYKALNGCYTIEIEDVFEGVAQLVVKEKQGEGCPGESGTPAVLDRFVANPVGDDFEWYWMKEDGETEPYENAKKKRR